MRGSAGSIVRVEAKEWVGKRWKTDTSIRQGRGTQAFVKEDGHKHSSRLRACVETVRRVQGLGFRV